MSGIVWVLALVGCGSSEVPVDITVPPTPVLPEPGPVVEPPENAPDPITPSDVLLPDATLSTSAGLVNPGFATGSTPIVLDTNGDTYVVNPDSGSVSRMTPARAVTEVSVGLQPSRLAIANRTLFVSLRGQRSVVAIDLDDFAAGVVGEVAVGGEPMGLVAREDGTRVYVAVSQSGYVAEIDAASLEVSRAWSTPGEPRFLALHPTAGTLYVGLARVTPLSPGLLAFDLTTGARTSIATPATFSSLGTDLDSRLTGDLWVTADGAHLLAPTLYMDTQQPIFDGVTPLDTSDTALFGFGGGYNSSVGDPVGRLTPTVVDVPLDASGAAQPGATAMFASMFTVMGTVGTYITSVSATSDGAQYLATMEASNAVVLLDATEDAPFLTTPGALEFSSSELQLLGFRVPIRGLLSSAPGVSGAVARPDGSTVGAGAFADGVMEWSPTVPTFAGLIEGVVPHHATLVTSSPLPDWYRDGRARFYGATDPSMTSGGVSCSTCHVDGRDDGVVWTFASGPRQTKSLAGVVSETTPVTWASNVASVSQEAELTMMTRMGGFGLPASSLENLARFVDATPLPDVPGPDADAVARGAELFVETGCQGCHYSARYTSQTSFDIRGVMLDTPSLTGIAGSAPYFHDGRAPTLRDVLERSRDGSMGNTSSLSSAEMDDLEAFLRAL
ncbi:MAG: c-type cytochrome [Myxococcota bacterium]